MALYRRGSIWCSLNSRRRSCQEMGLRMSSKARCPWRTSNLNSCGTLRPIHRASPDCDLLSADLREDPGGMPGSRKHETR